jgi:phospholipid transport system substrate-binding protein
MLMKSVSRVFVMTVMLLLTPFMVAQSMAQTAGLSAVEAAEQSVNQLLQKVQELRPYFDSDKDRYYAGVEEEVGKFVDFREVAVGVMARYSQQASEEQILAFGEKLRSTLTRFYGSALVEYGGQQLTFLPSDNAPAEPGAGTNVRMQIVADGARIELQYALFQNAEGEWKLRNIFVSGINLRRQYNTQFTALMARHNNDIDQVIAAWQ